MDTYALCHQYLCFGPDGIVITAVVNAPGSMHDSTVAELGGIYDLIFQNYNRNHGQCIMDSAFASTTHEAIIKLVQNPEVAADVAQMVIFCEATSLHQSAEWGMHAIQSSFPCLNEHILYEENGERLVIIHLATLLYNF